MKEKNTAPDNMKRLLMMGAAAVIISFVAMSVLSKNGDKSRSTKGNVKPVSKAVVEEAEATVL